MIDSQFEQNVDRMDGSSSSSSSSSGSESGIKETNGVIPTDGRKNDRRLNIQTDGSSVPTQVTVGPAVGLASKQYGDDEGGSLDFPTNISNNTDRVNNVKFEVLTTDESNTLTINKSVNYLDNSLDNISTNTPTTSRYTNTQMSPEKSSFKSTSGKVTGTPPPQRRASVSMKGRLSSYNLHLVLQMIKQDAILSDSVASAKLKHSIMGRGKFLCDALQKFKADFELECKRSFLHVHTTVGTAEITPIQALHLPESTRPTFVTVSYGADSKHTESIPAATNLTWLWEGMGGHSDAEFNAQGAEPCTSYSSRDADNRLSKAEARRRKLERSNMALTKTFEVDTLNNKGVIRVAVIEESFPTNTEVAFVELPVFRFLDCTLEPPGQAYERYFPLTLTQTKSAVTTGLRLPVCLYYSLTH